jgi:hypothetical protein
LRGGCSFVAPIPSFPRKREKAIERSEIPFPFRKCPLALNVTPNRHGEARKAVAIQKYGAKELDRFAVLAMTNQ